MAGSVGNLNIKVGFDGSDAADGLAKLTNDLSKFGSDTEKYFEKFNQLGSLFGSLGSGGGLQIAGLATMATLVAKVTSETSKQVSRWETIARSSEAHAENVRNTTNWMNEWDTKGPVGKLMDLPGMAVGSAFSGAGKQVSDLMGSKDERFSTTNKDSAAGLGRLSLYADTAGKSLQAMADGAIGPFSALANLDPTGALKNLNDWSDYLFSRRKSGKWETTGDRLENWENEKQYEKWALERAEKFKQAWANAAKLEEWAAELIAPTSEMDKVIQKLKDEIEGLAVTVQQADLKPKLEKALEKVENDKAIAEGQAWYDKMMATVREEEAAIAQLESELQKINEDAISTNKRIFSLLEEGMGEYELFASKNKETMDRFNELIEQVSGDQKIALLNARDAKLRKSNEQEDNKFMDENQRLANRMAELQESMKKAQAAGDMAGVNRFQAALGIEAKKIAALGTRQQGSSLATLNDYGGQEWAQARVRAWDTDNRSDADKYKEGLDKLNEINTQTGKDVKRMADAVEKLGIPQPVSLGKR